jgi:hypothetical protein
MPHRRIGWATGICLVAAAAAAAAVLAGCDKGTSSGSSSSSASSSSSSPGTGSQQQPVKALSLSVQQFADKFKEWMSNGINAPKPEESQGLFEVSGLVDRVEASASGEGIVLLRPTSDTDLTEARQNRRLYVQALTNEKEPWARLARGQLATLRGKLGALPAPPNLDQANIVEAGPPTAVNLSASDLASQHSKGEEGLKGLYDGKDVIVTGKVSDVRSSVINGLTLFLEGDGKVRVRCDLGVTETQRLGDALAPKQGQTVRVFGEVHPSNLTETIVPMKGCHLITK